MKFEHVEVFNFENALRGMRNPLNSWNRIDSLFGVGSHDEFTDAVGTCISKWYPEEENLDQETIDHFWNNGVVRYTGPNDYIEWALIGPKDMKTATGLIHAGPEHRKFMRQIMITVDITAPLYWWKEFDTYKIGTTANSTSTMHKMLAKPITLDCFEIGDFTNLPYPVEMQREEIKSPCDTDFIQMCLIPYLEYLRQTAINCGDAGDEETQKIYWKELIRWLPESWLQTRTVTMNYENLRTMYHQRKNHKLVEWKTEFINFIKSLPYSDEFIIN